MTQFTDLPTEFLHFFRLLSIGIYKNFPGLSVYFSLYILMLASLNAILHKNLTPKENNIWIYLAVFMAMVIFITSAARSGRDWHADAAEPRFKVLSIFLILILTIHGLLLSRHIIHRLRAKIIGSLIIINSVALMLLAHHSYYPTSFHLSNKTLSTHTDILMKGADRITGRWLGRGILFRTEQDPLAHMDPFFKANGYAYYDNKVIRSGTALQAIKPGDQLVNPNELDIFSKTCRINQSPLETYSDGEIPVIFSTAIDPETQNNLLSSLHRNSYFTLDTSGVVIGYAYIFIDQNNYNIQTYLRGLSNSPDIQYIAEISHNQAKCLYQISPVKP